MAVHGYRRFKVRDDRLTGACITSAVWSSRIASAFCINIGVHSDPRAIKGVRPHLLADSCTCGYYAYKGRDYKAVEMWDLVFAADATAAVTMWGAVREYEHGYRAEHMQIDHIWLDGPVSYETEQQAAVLTAQYDVGCDIGGTPPRALEIAAQAAQKQQQLAMRLQQLANDIESEIDKGVET